jgi:hypothetical protein
MLRKRKSRGMFNHRNATRETETMTRKATAHDNRIERKACILDTVRPFVAVKPKGYINPVIGHYATMAAAKKAAERFNANQ